MTTANTNSKRSELFMALAGARLKGRRQWEVAAEAGMDPARLSRILNREREPTSEQAVRLAAVLDVPAAELFPDLPAAWLQSPARTGTGP